MRLDLKGKAASPIKKCGKGSVESGTLGGTGTVPVNTDSPNGDNRNIPVIYEKLCVCEIIY